MQQDLIDSEPQPPADIKVDEAYLQNSGAEVRGPVDPGALTEVFLARTVGEDDVVDVGQSDKLKG